MLISDTDVIVPVPHIYQAMIAIMKDLKAISKDQRNAAQGFKFRGIEDVYNAVQPIMAQHGVFCVPEVLWHETTWIKGTDKFGKERTTTHVLLKMKYRYYTWDGSFVDAVTMGEASDHGDKAYGKAASYAHKVATLQTFCIPTKDADDPDKDQEEAQNVPATRQQSQPVRPAARKPSDDDIFN
jgi:hypothetical protein